MKYYVYLTSYGKTTTKSITQSHYKTPYYANKTWPCMNDLINVRKKTFIKINKPFLSVPLSSLSTVWKYLTSQKVRRKKKERNKYNLFPQRIDNSFLYNRYSTEHVTSVNNLKANLTSLRVNEVLYHSFVHLVHLRNDKGLSISNMFGIYFRS